MENKGFNTYIRDLENTIIKVTDDALKQASNLLFCVWF